MLIFSIIFLFLVGLPVGAVRAQTETSTDFFPLQVGNKWVYEFTVGFKNYEGLRVDFQEQVVLEVLGEEEVEGKTYFRLNTGQLIRKNQKGDILEYNDRFDRIQDTEMLVYDFSSPANGDEDTFAYRMPYEARPPTIGGSSLTQNSSYTRYDTHRSFHRGEVYVDDYDFFIPRGEFDNVLLCAFFSYNDFPQPGWYILFAPDIGIVFSASSGSDTGGFGRYFLVEAVIDGEQRYPSRSSTFERPPPGRSMPVPPRPASVSTETLGIGDGIDFSTGISEYHGFANDFHVHQETDRQTATAYTPVLIGTRGLRDLRRADFDALISAGIPADLLPDSRNFFVPLTPTDLA